MFILIAILVALGVSLIFMRSKESHSDTDINYRSDKRESVGFDHLTTNEKVFNQSDEAFETTLRDFISDNKKIVAIKYARDQKGLSLKDAKELVDKLDS